MYPQLTVDMTLRLSALGVIDGENAWICETAHAYLLGLSTTKGAPWSRARPSTGRACSRSTDRSASTPGKSNWKNGKPS
jgi:hypothetical protein